MGITQSSLDARPEQLETVGPFALRSTTKNAINILSDITTSLLAENSLFKLKDLLSKEKDKGCNDLFIFISSTVEKQFALLKIPDPAFPSKSATVGFLEKDKFGTKETPEISSARLVACSQISIFLVRLVTLMCALTASIKLSTTEAAAHERDVNLKTLKDSSQERKAFLPKTISGTSVDEALIQFFKNIGDKASIFGNDKKLQTLNGLDKYVWNTQRGLFYKDEGRSPVFIISMNTETVTGYEPPPGAYQGTSGSVSTGTGSITGTAKSNNVKSTGILPGLAKGGFFTRRRGLRANKSTRRHRRHVGGGEQLNLYHVILTEQPVGIFGLEHRAEPIRIPFYFGLDGSFYRTEDIEIFKTKPIKPRPRDISELATFLDDIFKKIVTNRVDLVKEDGDLTIEQSTQSGTEDGSRKGNLYLPLKGINEATYIALEKLQKGLDSPIGASPAGYRAYLLASSLRSGILDTKFCEDSWRGSVFTSSIAYAFLQLLYEDGRSETPITSEAQEDLEKITNAFVGTRLATQEPTSTSKTLRNILFAPLPGGLDSFCKRPVASRVFNKPEQVAILTTAQKSLRRMFDAHVGAVVKFVERIMTIKRRPTGEYYFRLNEQFVKSPLGALKLLESMIAEARNMLAKHYLEVELTYNSALLKVGDVR